LEFGNGQFLDGATESWGNLGLHQYEDKNADRSFSLIETPTPVPEPSTLAVASMLLGISWTSFVRKRIKPSAAAA